MASSGYDDATQTFLHWFRALPGADFSSALEIVDLRFRNAGRGIVATQDIPTDSTLFKVPAQALIKTETSPLRQQLPYLFESLSDGDSEQGLNRWSGLILVLIYEYLLGPLSFWKPYLDVLPEEFDTPMFWSGAELAELQASPVLSKIGLAKADDIFRTRLLLVIRSRPDVFRASVEYSDDQLVRLAHRMGSTIMAYSFDLENDDDDDDDDDSGEDGWIEEKKGKLGLAMIPMADILNADAEFNAHVNHGDDNVTVTSLRPIKAGDEILNYYGPLPSSELLRRYGYVTEKHGRYDVIEIPWSLVENAAAEYLNLTSDLLEQARKSIPEDELESTFVLERDSAEPNSDGTLTGLASIHDMPCDLHSQLKAFLKALQKVDQKLVQDKRRRDEAQQAILARSILAIESQYSTTMAEDQLLLRRGGLSQRRTMAILVRLGEKRLLEEAKSFLLKSSGDEALDKQSKTAKKIRHAE